MNVLKSHFADELYDNGNDIVGELDIYTEAMLEDKIREMLKIDEDGTGVVELVAPYGRRAFVTVETSHSSRMTVQSTTERYTGIVPDHSFTIMTGKFSHYHGKYSIWRYKTTVVEIYEPRRLG